MSLEDFNNFTPPLILTPSQIAIQKQLTIVVGILTEQGKSNLSFRKYGLGQEAEGVQRTQEKVEQRTGNEGGKIDSTDVPDFGALTDMQLMVLCNFIVNQKVVENTIEEKPIFEVINKSELLRLIGESQFEQYEKN